MEYLLARIAAAVAVFAGTNVDDIVLLTVLFLACRAAGSPKAWHIWAGQYVGIAVLVLASGAGALGLTVVPDEWVGLMGLLPLALGVRGLLNAFRSRKGNGQPDDRSKTVSGGLLSVAGVTVANGSDNIAAYTPLFRTIGVGGSLVTVAVFALMVAAWCAAGSWLASHQQVIAVVERNGRWMVPAVFVGIGTIILVGSGVTRLALGLR